MPRIFSRALAWSSLVVLSLECALAAVVTDVKPVNSLQHFRAFSLNQSGNAAIILKVGTGDQGAEALFLLLSDGSRIPVAVAGRPAPFPGRVYGSIVGFELNNRNNLIFEAWVVDQETNTWETGLFFYSHAARRVVPVIPSGYLEPDHEFLAFDRFSLNDRDQAVMAIDVRPRCATGSCPSEGNDRLLLFDGEKRELTELARETAENGLYDLGRPVLNDGGAIAVPAARPSNSSFGLYRWVSPGVLQEVLAPGHTLQLSESVTLDHIAGMVMSESGLLVFSASFLRSTPPRGGVFSLSPDNRLFTLAYDGQEFGSARFPLHSSGIFSSLFERPSLVSINGRDEVALGATEIPPVPRSGTTLFYPRPESDPTVVIDGMLKLGEQDYWVRPLGFNDSSELVFLALGIGEADDALILREASGQFRKILDVSSLVPNLVDPSLVLPGPLIRSLLNDRGELALLVQGMDGGLSREAWFVVDTRTGQFRKLIGEGDEVDTSVVRSRLVFPQFADGSYPGPAAVWTELNLYNPNAWSSAISVAFHHSSGEPAEVQIGETRNSVFEYTIAPFGSLVLETSPLPTPQKGYTIVESESELGGLEVISSWGFGALQAQVGVLPSVASRDFVFPIQTKDGQNAGVALVNLNPVAAEITLEARDSGGTLVRTESRTLEAGHQLALYAAGELFPDLPELTGSVRVRSSVELYKVGIRTFAGGMLALPVLE